MNTEEVIDSLVAIINGLLSGMNETENAQCVYCHVLIGAGQPHTSECIPASYLYQLGYEIHIDEETLEN